MRFGLLGEVSAAGPDGPVDVGHSRQRNVLAVLLVDANRPVSADQLLDRVWGDRPPATARGTLFTYLTRLRQALAPVPIERRSGGYQITVEPGALDLDVYTDLVARARQARDDTLATGLYRQAAELWRGDPLTGLDTPWANDIRDRLRRERFAAELDHTDVRLRLGEHAALLSEITSRAVIHPLDERLAGQLILALYRSGRLADALAHFQAFRDRLRDELGVDPGLALRELHQRVLADDQAVQPPTRADRTPRQLPPAPRAFTGRTNEFALLGQSTGTYVISAIGGVGGVGKTALALHWARLNTSRFPDGQLFVNLRGFDPSGQPTTPTAALRGFLTALGVSTSDVPRDVDARSALYRSLVAGRRMLVVLDNAVDTAQVDPLLPGSTSVTTLVTSRRPLTGLVAVHGAQAVPLNILSDNESHELLAARLGARLAAEPEAAAELVAHCAGLPLALSIVAARASVDPDLSLAVLAGQLRDQATRLDGLDTGEADLSLRAVFALSHQALTPDTARFVGLLALAPGPDISASAADALAGVPAKRMLSELEAAHLVFEYTPGRYRMHDLVRLDATERAAALPAAVRTTALRRLTGFYLHTAYAADRLVDPERPGIELTEPFVAPAALSDEGEAVAWLVAEHPCLLATQQLAVAQGWHAAVWELALVTDTLHWRQGLTADHVAVIQAAIDAAEAAGDRDIQARMHGNYGAAALRVGDVTGSMRHLERAIELADTVMQRAHWSSTLAQAWSMHGDNDQALICASRSLDLYRQTGETWWEAHARNQLGWVLAMLGRYDEAREQCLTAVGSQQAENRVEPEIFDSLGYIDEHSGRLADAVDWYTRAITGFEVRGDTYNVASSLIQLGRANHALGDADAAARAWRRALDLCERQRRTAEAAKLREWLTP